MNEETDFDRGYRLGQRDAKEVYEEREEYYRWRSADEEIPDINLSIGHGVWVLVELDVRHNNRHIAHFSHNGVTGFDYKVSGMLLTKLVKRWRYVSEEITKGLPINK